MNQHATIDFHGLKQIIDTFEKLERGGASMLIKASARICAVQLALHTQPFSVGEKGEGEAYKKGTKRVEYDVYKAIRSNAKLSEIADYVTDENIQKRLRELIDSGKYEAVAKILRATNISLGFGDDVEVLRTLASVKAAHTKCRSKKTGRVYDKRHRLYIAPQELINRYILEAQKRVGRSKAGWSDCARKINATKGDGARGAAAWFKAKRHGQNGSVDDASSGIDGYRYVEMHNMVPWSSRLISARDIQASERFAKANLVKSLQKSFAAAAKKHPDILGFIQNEVDQTNEGE